MLAPPFARAARPLLDQHQWDGYFALFAQDASLPWKATTVRLDTYSGAPVDFAAYAMDPVEVIVAGSTRPARAIDTTKRRATTRWRFSPPPGYRFETSDIAVPLGSSEGFYVIEARRGDAAQQVWINRSRLGLVTKESPEGLVVWAVDLGTGRAARDLRIEFLAGGKLVARNTDRSGLITWREGQRPTFALAATGGSRAFVSLLPQAPLPPAVVGVRVESAIVRAGERVRVVGFARRRSGGVLRRAVGDAKVTLIGGGTTLAAAATHLDGAGAFFAELPVPTSAAAGDYTVLAAAAGGAGGTSLHVDAAARLALTVAPECPCEPEKAVPLVVAATHDGAPASGVGVNLEVVRAPHIVPPGESDEKPRWGTTRVLQVAVTTGSDGRARVFIPPPTDGLASTYGVRAATTGDGATASAQVAVPTAAVAVAIEPDAPAVDVGQAVGFTIRGFAPADGAAEPGVGATVRLAHGATIAEQTVRLDANGRAHAVFHDPSLGSNLATAEIVTANGRHALDASSVSVAPRGIFGVAGATESEVSIVLDRSRYRPGDRVGVTVAVAGAGGDALVTLEGARTYATRIVPLAGGRGATTFDLPEVEGDVHVGAAVVRDGMVALGTIPLQIDAPGHVRAMTLAFDRTVYAAGEVAKAGVRDEDPERPSTVVVRLTDGRPSGGAVLDDMPVVLSAGGTTSQNSAAENAAWHAWVAPARSKVGDIFAAERPRAVKIDVPSIGSAAPRTLLWRMDRSSTSSVEVPLPRQRGTYVLSILRVFDDGDVGAAEASVIVQ
jgi:uncharacterized protein YfaS (alpha-2-macroglobulin family)